MFLADKGKAWARTEKVDADRRFVSYISRTPDVPPTQDQIP